MGHLTWFELWTIAQAVVMGVATLLLITLRLGFRSAKWMIGSDEAQREIAALKKAQDDFDARLEASCDELERKISNEHDRIRALTEKVNALPVSLARTFLPRNEADLMQRECRNDRSRIQREVEHLRDRQ